jgi:hypothetical protein
VTKRAFSGAYCPVCDDWKTTSVYDAARRIYVCRLDCPGPKPEPNRAVDCVHCFYGPGACCCASRDAGANDLA